jgi:hypothetical protein
MDETTTEILSIKKGLKKRFENVQNGKFEYKKKQRNNKPRAQGERGGQGRKTYNDDGENMRGGRRAYDGDKRAYDGDKNDNSSRYQVKK